MTTFALVRAKIQGTTVFSGGTLRRLRDRDRLWILPLAGLGVLAGGGGFLAVLLSNYLLLYRLGVAAGNPSLVLSVGLAAAWVFVFVALFPVALSTLYLSRDNLLLLTLPLPAARIVGANLLLLYLYGLPVVLLVFLPASAVYLYAQGPAPASVIATVLVVLTGSLLPLGLAVLAVLAVTGVAPLSRHRMAMEIVGMGLLVVILVLLQSLLSRSMMGQLAATSAGGMPLRPLVARGLTGLQRALPPLAWAAGAFSGLHGLACLGAYVAGSAAWVAAVLAVTQAVYARQLRRQQERRVAWRRVAGRRALSPPRPIWRALVFRELAVLFSNSSFGFEAAAEILIVPIVLAVFSLLVPASLRQQLVPQLRGSPFTLPAAGAVLALFAGFNTVSATSLSREGRLFALSQSLPLRGRDHLRGKLLCFLVLFYPAYAANSCILAAILALKPVDVLALVAAGLAVLWLLFTATTYADLHRPLLDWSHPQQAMKQNTNVLVGMGLTLCVLAPLGAAGAGLVLAGLPGRVAVLGSGVLAAVLVAALYPRLRRYADGRYAAGLGA